VYQLNERYSRRVDHDGADGFAQGNFGVVAVIYKVQLGCRNIGEIRNIEACSIILYRKIEQSYFLDCRRWPGYDGNLQEPHTDTASAEPSEHAQNVSLDGVGLERDSINRRYRISDNGVRLGSYHRSRGWRRRFKDNSRQLRDGPCKHDLPDIGSIDDARRSNATPQFIAVDHGYPPT
jgi:hypothetical protein